MSTSFDLTAQIANNSTHFDHEVHADGVVASYLAGWSTLRLLATILVVLIAYDQCTVAADFQL